jgi:hypothetical protein
MKGLLKVVIGVALIGVGIWQLLVGHGPGGGNFAFLLNLALAGLIMAVGAVFLVNR